MNTYINNYLQKIFPVFLLTISSFWGLGQNIADNAFEETLCGCHTINKTEVDRKLNENDAIKLYYSNGKIKYNETKKKEKIHKIYYYQTGNKCKEEFLNFKLKIRKTFLYDTLEKKQMVCKGSLKF